MITSLALALYLLGFAGAKSVAVFLFICGVMLIASEFLFPSGVVAFNGLLAIYIAYSLAYGQSLVFGAPVGWGVFFGIAFAELLLWGIFIALIVRHRRLRTITGTEGMIGHAAEIVDWHGEKGSVRVQGETWNAVATAPLDLKKHDRVTIESVDNLVVKIRV